MEVRKAVWMHMFSSVPGLVGRGVRLFGCLRRPIPIEDIRWSQETVGIRASCASGLSVAGSLTQKANYA